MNGRRSQDASTRSGTSPTRRDVVEELGERVVASRSEPGHDAAVGLQVCGEVLEHRPARVGIEERQDVAGAHHDVERVRDAHRWEVEFSEVHDHPNRARVILLGGGDQDRVDVDADDVVPRSREMAPDPSRSAAGVEHPDPARDDGVDEACFSVEIVPGWWPSTETVRRTRSECPGFRSISSIHRFVPITVTVPTGWARRRRRGSAGVGHRRTGLEEAWRRGPWALAAARSIVESRSLQLLGPLERAGWVRSDSESVVA